MVSRQELESLLKIQRESYNDTVNHLVVNFNSQIEALKLELNAVKTELQSTKEEVSSKGNLIAVLSSKVEELELSVESSKTDPVQIFDRLDSLEDHSRRNNLRFEGVPETPRENWEHTTVQIQELAKKIGIDHDLKIDRAHRVGNPSASNRPRTIIARFHYYSDRDLFLRNAHKLKGTRIFVNEDLCQTSLNRRKEQLPLLQQARREGKIAYFSHTKLIVKDRAQSASANLVQFDANSSSSSSTTQNATISASPETTPEEVTPNSTKTSTKPPQNLKPTGGPKDNSRRTVRKKN